METERTFGLPDIYKEKIAAKLQAEGTSLSKPADIAKAVMKLSDFYKDQPKEQTPWHQAWARIAYLAYFFPLNYARAAAVIAEGKRTNFFAGIDRWTDFGSGCGTVACAAEDAGILLSAEATMIERAQSAIDLHKALQRNTNLTKFRLTPASTGTQDSRGHLASFSYSLTELNSIPEFAKKSAAFMIIEPATRDDGRRLLGWRQKFIDDGYAVHAPCTHQLQCPLLKHSERDWCHDRISFAAPDWYLDIEKHLPIKNRTLTFSYLLTKTAARPERPVFVGRLTGDLMKEKGASRQMFCRGEQREFLSWQHKLGEVPHFPRGIIVTYPETINTKSNELRPGLNDIAIFESV
jgi:ribosomal protein RSM22 (predicted rRNA methylase)